MLGFLSLSAKESDSVFSKLFRYRFENYYRFNAIGKPVKEKNLPVRRSRVRDEISLRIQSDGSYQIAAAGYSLRGAPGEQIFPGAVVGGRYYLLSEAGFAFRTLIRWDPPSGTIHSVAPPYAADALNIISDQQEIIGVQYFDRHCSFFKPQFEAMHKKILAQYPDAFPLWHEKSPVCDNQWLVEIWLPDRPSLWCLAEVSLQTMQIVSESVPIFPESGKKQMIAYTSCDGTVISAVLSYPPARYGEKLLPLVVFPHGGPGSVELPYFDPRVAFLTAHGFLVLQPNYRGSAGSGKDFRFLGWQANGIRNSLEDIACGAKYLIEKGIADRDRIAILGGSWGGYCALASLCFYPDLYRCGVSLFGASDLPEMLRSFPQKSHADEALDRLQYGDVKDPAAVKKLEAISPVFLAEKITAPVLLVHYRQDQVIEFSQSATFYEKMRSRGKIIEFISGDGEHGFDPPEKEAEVYRQIVDFIQEKFKEETE